MIVYEIVNSCDQLLLGDYNTGHNHIIFSNTKNYYTFIQDPEFKTFELVLSAENILELKTSPNTPISINDVKFMGSRQIKIGDLISSGSTTIKIIKFAYTQNFYKSEISSLLESSPERKKNANNISSKINLV